MKATFSTDKEALLALAAHVDAELGYPKAGVNGGGGKHAPPEQSMTLRHMDVDAPPVPEGTKPPDGPVTYCYCITDESEPVVEKRLAEAADMAASGKGTKEDAMFSALKCVDAEHDGTKWVAADAAAKKASDPSL